jgi:hypothetical protein
MNQDCRLPNTKRRPAPSETTPSPRAQNPPAGGGGLSAAGYDRAQISGPGCDRIGWYVPAKWISRDGRRLSDAGLPVVRLLPTVIREMSTRRMIRRSCWSLHAGGRS